MTDAVAVETTSALVKAAWIFGMFFVAFGALVFLSRTFQRWDEEDRLHWLDGIGVTFGDEEPEVEFTEGWYIKEDPMDVTQAEIDWFLDRRDER